MDADVKGDALESVDGASCYVHGWERAVLRCAECERPICETCRSKKDERGVCYPCHAAGPSEAPGADGAVDAAAATRKPENYLKRHARAALVGGVAALFIGFAWAKFVFFARHDSYYFVVFAILGVAVPVSVCDLFQRSVLRGLIGAFWSGACVLLQHVFLTYDALMANPEAGRMMRRLPWADLVVPLFRTVFANMEAKEWAVLVVAVVVGGFVAGAGGTDRAGG